MESTHLQLTEVRPPAVLHQMVPVAFGEVTQVGDEGSDEEDIPAQCSFLSSKVFYCLRPSNIFSCKTTHLEHKRSPENVFHFLPLKHLLPQALKRFRKIMPKLIYGCHF